VNRPGQTLLGLESQSGFLHALAAMVVLTVGLGYMEAAVVVYLREISAPIRQRYFPREASEPLPLLGGQQLAAAGGDKFKILAIEMTREPAPLAVLAAFAWVLGRTRRMRVGLFLVGFGLWDILYYVFLKLLIDWPKSLASWDVLYLIPAPWVAPVWAALASAVTMLALGAVAISTGRAGQKARSPSAWLAIVCGVALVLVSFFLRTREAFDAVPVRYDWYFFVPGWVLTVGGSLRLLCPAFQPAGRCR